ncbi:MAG: SAM-dependent methyltransferase, partial [Alphaproteobacteria bacterium]|nr:SAM-dependent methyltransferase [Alphaproteobacteria bacterium]
MELALQHPDYGYYRKRDPLGRTGDFITAPEVSQLFGEMIGVWCAEAWRSMGRPDPFALVELGPGRGTMMADILRATVNVKGFHAAKKLVFLDSNETLRKRQVEVLGAHNPVHIDDISQAPAMPTLILANEFFDSLPVRQFEKTHRGWTERMAATENGSFVSALRPLNEAEALLVPEEMREASIGTVFEFSPAAQNLMREIARVLKANGGGMLLIDYGYTAPSGAPTVQAASEHASTDIFDRPGEVDLTAHVDFSALAEAARGQGLQVSAVVGQGEFLENCGIGLRADSLKTHATEQQAADIDSALHRLTDGSQMGSLFKVMEIRA